MSVKNFIINKCTINLLNLLYLRAYIKNLRSEIGYNYKLKL
jgi:hypothetical protein